MNALAILVLAQLAAPTRRTPPVLAFPEAGLDDSAAYQGYQTRFYRDPFSAGPFVLPETDRLVRALERLDPAERRRQLEMLHARDIGRLKTRLRPITTTHQSATSWVARVAQPSFDGLDTLVLEVRVDPRRVAATRAGDSLSLRPRSGREVPFTIRISTTGKPLTRLT